MNKHLLLPLLLGISLNTNAFNIEASLNTTAKINMPSFTTAIHYVAICSSIFISICLIDSLFSDNYPHPIQDIQNNIAVFIIPSSNEELAELTKGVLDTNALSDIKYINVQQDGE